MEMLVVGDGHFLFRVVKSKWVEVDHVGVCDTSARSDGEKAIIVEFLLEADAALERFGVFVVKEDVNIWLSVLDPEVEWCFSCKVSHFGLAVVALGNFHEVCLFLAIIMNNLDKICVFVTITFLEDRVHDNSESIEVLRVPK